jgi:3-mercaptopyruvate sulfurtransferase SseA
VGKEVILYSSSLNEVSSARVALMLSEKGLDKVHALSGGIDTWHARCYPVEKRILLPEARPGIGAVKQT